jgi:site-specific DNA-methyltransferase (adenine-specific)
MKTNGGFVGKVGKEKAESYFYEETGERYPTDVIEFSNWNGALFGNTDHSVVHPTQKPVDLVGYLVLTYSNEGDLVIDFFGGSGTTLIACEQLGRKCYMMEIDPHYCDVILARWEKLTGKQARKIN